MTNKNRVSTKVAPIFRCKSCNRVNVVIYREMADDMQLQSLHQGMPNNDKTEWLALPHEEFDRCTSDIIRKSLEKFVKAKSTRTSSITGESTFQTKYNWLDEDDLRNEYKDKPDIIKDTLKDAKTCTCQVAKRKLYGVPLYDSNTMEKAATEVEHKVVATTEAQQQPAMKPRIALISFLLCCGLA